MSAHSSPYPGGPYPTRPYPTREAVRTGDYERAALRLVYGFLAALDETAPDAREELLHLLVERRRGGP